MSDASKGALPGVRIGVFFIAYRYIALVLLMAQTTAVVLSMRFSRTVSGPRYLSTTAVVMSELFKVAGSLLLLWNERRGSLADAVMHTHEEVFVKWRDTLLLGVPALLYTVQNNLLFVALSNLPAATYQITYQLKILTTALFSVLLLRRELNMTKWISLVVLMVGVALVEMPSGDTAAKPTAHVNQFVGLVAVLSACCLSGFAGVYIEKTLKSSRSSLWIRNIQLGLYGVLLGTIGVYLNDREEALSKGFFVGYNSLTWLVISLQAFGGLVIAAVILYADNIMKSFATSLSIILTYVMSMAIGLENPHVSFYFLAGTGLVITATFLYGLPDAPKPVLPTTSPTKP